VCLAIRTGVSHEVWLEDTRALATAIGVITDADRKSRTRGH